MWSDREATAGTLPSEFSRVAITLMKGVLYRDASPAVWQALLRHQPGIRDYMGVLGLELLLDEGEGYAFLMQEDPPEGTPPSQELPRLVPQRPLGYLPSLLLVLLRKKIAESEARSGEVRLILTADDMIEMVRLFLPDTANEVRQQDRIRAQIGRIAEMGFLRKLPGPGDRYEVGRILKVFVNAQWIADFDLMLSAYSRGVEAPLESGTNPEESP